VRNFRIESVLCATKKKELVDQTISPCNISTELNNLFDLLGDVKDKDKQGKDFVRCSRLTRMLQVK
jgi:hypothetical protein